MAKRYYLCDIVGDGTDENPFRPAVAELPGINWSGEIPTGADGRPLHTQALVIVATQNHAAVRALAAVDPLPDFPLDGKVNAINAATMAVLKAALARRGFNANSIVDGKDGYRDVIRAVGQRFNLAFDENKFDVADR